MAGVEFKDYIADKDDIPPVTHKMIPEDEEMKESHEEEKKDETARDAPSWYYPKNDLIMNSESSKTFTWKDKVIFFAISLE